MNGMQRICNNENDKMLKTLQNGKRLYGYKLFVRELLELLLSLTLCFTHFVKLPYWMIAQIYLS